MHVRGLCQAAKRQCTRQKCKEEQRLQAQDGTTLHNVALLTKISKGSKTQPDKAFKTDMFGLGIGKPCRGVFKDDQTDAMYSYYLVLVIASLGLDTAFSNKLDCSGRP